MQSLATRLHHLRSTTSCAGIYNSPYHVGFHPTAFGVPVEEHLRHAIRPMIKQELLNRSKTLRPLETLPPIPPRLERAPYETVEDAERQERWVSKTQRVAGTDFMPAVSKPVQPYPGSIHAGTKYTPPLTLERSSNKSQWVSEQPFIANVPTNRVVDSAGSNNKYAL